MKTFEPLIHPELQGKTLNRIYHRVSVRGILHKEGKLLLIYTKRYDDYSLPGGGVEANESLEKALIREMEEETGAQNVRIIRPFGILEETRPIHYPEYDAMHQISHVFVCEADDVFNTPQMESYEQSNGSAPVWIPLEKALAHNQSVYALQPKHMGFSIEREIILLRAIEEELKLRGNE